jgi:PKD domain-containing protein
MTQHKSGAWQFISLGFLVGSILILVVSILDIIGRNSLDALRNRPLTVNWIGMMIASLLFLVWLGYLINDKWFGVLIDSRNKYSLSRLQLILWLVLIVTAILITFVQNYKIPAPNLTIYITGAVQRTLKDVPAGCTLGDLTLSDGKCNPKDLPVVQADLSQVNLGQALQNGDHLYIPSEGTGTAITQSQTGVSEPTGRDFKIPDEILVLLGISTTSLIGSSLLKSTKDQNPNNDSKIQLNSTPEEARFSDLVKGEETQNFGTVDLAKVQMLYITVGLVIAYGIALAEMFQVNAGSVISQFPPVASGIVLLLGISHAGYLANKAIPKELTGIAITSEKDPSAAANPLRVQFKVPDDDTNTAYAWNFGDGTASADKNPLHDFPQPGTYKVHLAATGPTGVSAGETDVTVPLP